MAEGLDTQAEIVAALRRIIRAVDLHSRYLAQKAGLTGPQLVVLQCLSRRGPQTAAQLARSISMGQATLSDLLDRLETREFIQRQRSTEDKRRVINQLTAAGKAAIDKSPPLLQERFVEELSRLADWEQTLVLSTLQRVATMMHAEKIEAEPVLVTGPIGASVKETEAYLAKEVAETGVLPGEPVAEAGG